MNENSRSGPLSERVAATVAELEGLARDYREDPLMSSDRAYRYAGWIHNGVKDLQDALSVLDQAEMTALLNAVEDVRSRNFYSGTGYGTCYGVRQAFDIVRNATSMYQDLRKEGLVLEYISALQELYVIRSQDAPAPMPLESYLTDEGGDDGWPFHTIRYINEEVHAVEGPGQRKDKLCELMEKARLKR